MRRTKFIVNPVMEKELSMKVGGLVVLVLGVIDVMVKDGILDKL
jgi:hypothetical protein